MSNIKNIKELLDSDNINCNMLIELIKNNKITKKNLIKDIPINKIVIGNKNIDTIKFIDYIAYIADFPYEISDIIKLICVIEEKFGKDTTKKLTCLKIDHIEQYFDSYVILPIYDIFLNKYFEEIEDDEIKNKRLECNICGYNNKSVKFSYCGHYCCLLCSAEIKKRSMKCHVCRSFIISRELITN